MTFLLERGHLPPCGDGVGTDVGENDGVFGGCFEMLNDGGDVAEASAPLEKFGCELHSGRKSGTGSIEWRRKGWRSARRWSGKDGGCVGTEGEKVVDFLMIGDGCDVGWNDVWECGRKGGPPLKCGECWRRGT